MAASPLDASLIPATDVKVGSAVGGIRASRKPATDGEERLHSAASVARRAIPTSRVRARRSEPPMIEVDELFDDQPVHAPPQSVPSNKALDRFAPYFQNTSPVPASARTSNYLRDPLVIERLVLL